MIILDTAGDTIQAEASAASSITVNCYGIETASGTDTYKRLGTAQLTGAATQDVIYTVPASTVTICSVIVIANTSGSARTIKLWDVENGGSPGDANAILGTVAIAANTTIIWNKGNIMTMPTSTGAGGAAAHAILDGSTHSDSVADAVTRGSIIYGNATPKWDELVVGGAGTVLSSDGTDISWGAAASGFGRPIVLIPQSGMTPATSFATLDTITGGSTPAEVISVLDFDADASEYMDFKFALPAGYAGNGLDVTIIFSMTSDHDEGTPHKVRWEAAFAAITDDNLDMNTDQAYDFNGISATVPSVVGEVSYDHILFSDGADMDSLAAANMAILRIYRDHDHGDDNATGDAELQMISIKENI